MSPIEAGRASSVRYPVGCRGMGAEGNVTMRSFARVGAVIGVVLALASACAADVVTDAAAPASMAASRMDRSFMREHPSR